MKNSPSDIYLHTNNAFNIRHNPSQWWQGQIGEYKGFVKFKDDWFSLRAFFIILNTYRDKYNIVTIRDIITRYAPPNENNTAKYIEDISRIAHLSGDDIFGLLDYKQKAQFVLAVARIETNVYLDYETVFQSLWLTD